MRQLYHIIRQINQYMRVFKIPAHIKEHPEVQKKYAMVLRAERLRRADSAGVWARGLPNADACPCSWCAVRLRRADSAGVWYAWAWDVPSVRGARVCGCGVLNADA